MFSLLHSVEIALLLVLTCILYVAIIKFTQDDEQTRKLLQAFPVVGLRNELLASFRATLRSLTKTGEWASEGYVKFAKSNSPYLISTIDRGLILMLPPKQMKTVYKLPEGRLDVFGTLQEQIKAQWTIRDDRIIRDPFHRYLLPRQLTRDLHRQTEPMVEEMVAAFEHSWGSCTDWKDINIWQSCFSIIARTVNTAYCGAPMCRNERYLKALEGQSLALFGGSTLIGIAPRPLKPVVGFFVRQWCNYYSRTINTICSPLIQDRIEATTRAGSDFQSNTGVLKDGLQLIVEESIARNDPSLLSTRLISDRLTITNNLTLHGVTFTVHHLLLALACSDPKYAYAATLREECRAVFQAAGQKWTLESLRRLRLLDSALRESMRFIPFSTVAMARTVVDPGGISLQNGQSKVIIPVGTTLAVPIECIHYDENIFPGAHKFDPFRFVKQGDSGSESDYTTIKPTTSPDDQFFGFGTSTNPCPGRFLAVHSIKLIMAHALLNYEWKHIDSKLALSNILAMKVPNQQTSLQVRRCSRQRDS
ncbi:cytochrome P450 [Xylaria arbuscula]|nr:cytochrome P450 [Xylaria arbuscula]